MLSKDNIRNVCILGHIDHGKTTLADGLVASNGIISSRLAGQLRYMDHLPQEQHRGITMKSSAIGLLKKHTTESGDENYLINLIDSPGHVDFASEVSTAVRLSDGAIVILDAVEGVCPQTRAVLRQAWQESLRPVLVLNKIDRLIVELQLTPAEALQHLQQLLERVNAVVAELFVARVMERAYKEKDANDQSNGVAEMDDANVYFNPATGNVIFASAFDCWAFRPLEFAKTYSRKWSCKAAVLEKTLWGDYYLQGKGRVGRGALAKGKRNLFEVLVLEPLWSVYQAGLISRDEEKLQRIVLSLEAAVPDRDMRNRDGRTTVRAVFAKWLPLAHCVLDAVIKNIPSPTSLTEERIEGLLSGAHGDFQNLPESVRGLKQAFLSCRSCAETEEEAKEAAGQKSEEAADVPTIAFVAKMFVPSEMPNGFSSSKTKGYMATIGDREIAQKRNAARVSRYLRRQSESEDAVELPAISEEGCGLESLEKEAAAAAAAEAAAEEEEEEEVCGAHLIAFARVFSGRVRPGQRIFVLHPKFDPAKIPEDISLDISSLPLGPVEGLKHVSLVQLDNVFQLMGRELRQLPNGMPAGNVVGLGGLGGVILKSATLSTTLQCPAFAARWINSDPIVCVAIEPERPKDLGKLERGLSQLERADPCMQLSFEANGETLISAAGEVHLQKCLEDLRRQFAPGVDFSVSPFRVPFRETLRRDTKLLAPVVETVVRLPHSSRVLRLRVRALPIVEEVMEVLEANQRLLRLASRLSGLPDTKKVQVFRSSLSAALARMRNTLKSGGRVNLAPLVHIDRLVACGPDRAGPNLLFCSAKRLTDGEGDGEGDDPSCGISGSRLQQLVVRGFRLATGAGPLCEEPMRGVAFVLEDMAEFEAEKDDDGPIVAANAGQVMSATAKACNRAMEAAGTRIMIAMYTMDLMVRTEVLGRLGAVVRRRHGRIIREELREGEDVFDVTAVIPVLESFGLADDIRKRTSGHALQPQLRFTHWEVQEYDPLGEPGEDDDEEREDWFRTIRLINSVRRRKGLFVREQLVECGEKQRTLSKKK